MESGKDFLFFLPYNEIKEEKKEAVMNKEMRVAVFLDKGKIEIEKFPIPKCDNDKLLIKTKACAICTWEQRVYRGTHNVQYPVIGGHEVSGYIVEVGKDLINQGWNVGDKVVVGATLPCGSCEHCKSGNAQNCLTFDVLDALPAQPYKGTGGMSEYMMQQPRCVTKYANVSAQEACLSEPLSCVLHSVETVQPQFGDMVVVVGAGIMGLMHTQLCVRKGTIVIVVDMNEDRLKLAKQLGATFTINPDKENVEQRIIEISDGKKADHVFDTTPIANVVEESIQYVGNCGKLVIYSGIYPNHKISIDPHWIHKKGIQIVGTANSNERDFLRAVRMISYGIVDVKPFISGVWNIKDANKALDSACKGDKFRNILKMDFD